MNNLPMPKEGNVMMARERYEAMERDAARYRWLRNVAMHVRYTYWLDAAKTLHAGDGNLTGHQLDAGIDREMAMTARERCAEGGDRK